MEFLTNFFLENQNPKEDLIFYIVPLKDEVHPCENSILLLFIKNIINNKIYYFSFGHEDLVKTDFLYFHSRLIYIKNKIWVLDKKTVLEYMPGLDYNDINLCNLLNGDEIFNINEFYTSAHIFIKSKFPRNINLNKSIPFTKHLETFERLCESVENVILKYEINEAYDKINNIMIPVLFNIEKNGIYVNRDIFNKRFNTNIINNIVYSQYNIYTSTGRPSNRYNGINYAALNSKDNSRESFISRYGNDGKIVIIDYSGCHPRIICKLINYNIPVEIDVYEYLAKLYFQKENLSDKDISNSKKLTFKQFYGGIEDKYTHIKYFSNLKNYINEQWSLFKKEGYVTTPFFNRKITQKHIIDPDPNKLLNYILQATEGELILSGFKDVQSYLVNKKTKDILYIYDSIMFDFHKEDGLETLDQIRKIMSFDGFFPLKTYIGDSYESIKQISF